MNDLTSITPIYFNTNVNINHSVGFEPNHVIYEISFCVDNTIVTYTTVHNNICCSPFVNSLNQSYILFKNEQDLLRAFIKYIDTRQSLLVVNNDIVITYTSWDLDNLKNRFKYYGLKSINVLELPLLNLVQDLIKYKSYQFFAVIDDIFKTDFYNEYNVADNDMPTTIYVRYLQKLHQHLTKLDSKTSHGYHRVEIPKGVLGEFSKIEEEFTELKDAVDQNNPILISCELSDLIGAIEEYAKKYNLTLKDIISFSNLTKNAFESGKRK